MNTHKNANIKIDLEEIIALMPGHVYWKDKNGFLQGCNDEQAKDIGLKSRSEIIGLTAYDTLPKDLADQVTKNDKEVMNTGAPQLAEEILRLPDGKTSIWLSKKVPLYDDKGKVSGILGISIDITEKKQIDEELAQAKNERETIKQQLVTMETLSATIAHELRTPLAGIVAASEGAKKYFPVLTDAFKLAEEANLPIQNIRPSQFKLLSSVFDGIIDEVNQANTIINMLLLNVEQLTSQSKDFQYSSIAHCVEEALRHYSFQPTEKKLIKWGNENDFYYMGKELLTIHVIFNLLKNSLYYIKAAGKGEIHIWLEPGSPFNSLHFRDTGKGYLPRIYQKFLICFLLKPIMAQELDWHFAKL